ncbi:MAG: hypothetical protein NT151_01300 [Acidobacteria bacterium]|nr:hypothetical protein [Acidobacteriota bacterium]
MAWTRVLTCGLVVLLVVAGVSPARAGEIFFSIRDGRVTLVARDAQLSDILAVWEREGRTRIVARERVQGVVKSLELTNEPESAALATILRSVTGYIAARHPVPPRDGSTYRCIIINPVPAPAMLAQAGPVARTTPQPSSQTGMPQLMMGDPGMFPPAFIPPPPDDSDDGGASRGQMPAGGMRQPGMMSPAGIPRPQFDTATGYDPAMRSTQPARTPASFPGAGIVVPGAVVPAPQSPGMPTQPGQKPPGRPPGVG